MKVTKASRRTKIKSRIRRTVRGSADRPRLTVFRSNKQIYAQLIDDDEGKTVLTASSADKGFKGKGTKTEIAQAVGGEIAKKASAAGISAVVFDRNGYLYHGRVKALAEAVREGGLKL